MTETEHELSFLANFKIWPDVWARFRIETRKEGGNPSTVLRRMILGYLASCEGASDFRLPPAMRVVQPSENMSEITADLSIQNGDPND